MFFAALHRRKRFSLVWIGQSKTLVAMSDSPLFAFRQVIPLFPFAPLDVGVSTTNRGKSERSLPTAVKEWAYAQTYAHSWKQTAYLPLSYHDNVIRAHQAPGRRSPAPSPRQRVDNLLTRNSWSRFFKPYGLSFRGKKRFSRSVQDGQAVPPPRVLPFSWANRSKTRRRSAWACPSCSRWRGRDRP